MAIPWLSWIPGAGRWLWSKIRGRPTVQADRGALAAGRDQAMSAIVIFAQAGASVNVNVYVDDLPQAKAEIRDHFEKGQELQEAEQHEAAIREFEKALAAAEGDGQRCAIHTLIGNSFMNLARLAEAGGHYGQALQAADKARDKQGTAAALVGLGLVYADRDDLDRAEETYRKALAIHEEIGDRLGQARCLGNLGLVYADRGDLDKAEEHQKRALAIDQETGNRLGQAQDLGNLGNVYRQRGDLDKAEEHYRRVLGIHQEVPNLLSRATTLGNLGLVHLQRGHLDKAEEHFNKALAIYQEIGNRLGQAKQLASLALVAGIRGESGRASGLLNQAQALYEAIGAGGEGAKLVREALERLQAAGPPKGKPKRSRKKAPPKP